jgi:hypothetical protein
MGEQRGGAEPVLIRHDQDAQGLFHAGSTITKNALLSPANARKNFAAAAQGR